MIYKHMEIEMEIGMLESLERRKLSMKACMYVFYSGLITTCMCLGAWIVSRVRQFNSSWVWDTVHYLMLNIMLLHFSLIDGLEVAWQGLSLD